MLEKVGLGNAGITVRMSFQAANASAWPLRVRW